MRSTVADTLPPRVRRSLTKLGVDIALARKKRSLTVVMMAERTGKTFAEIEKDADRDYYMSADEAKKYGIVDKVLQ